MSGSSRCGLVQPIGAPAARPCVDSLFWLMSLQPLARRIVLEAV
jgi:hypothetical protein